MLLVLARRPRFCLLFYAFDLIVDLAVKNLYQRELRLRLGYQNFVCERCWQVSEDARWPSQFPSIFFSENLSKKSGSINLETVCTLTPWYRLYYYKLLQLHTFWPCHYLQTLAIIFFCPSSSFKWYLVPTKIYRKQYELSIFKLILTYKPVFVVSVLLEKV